MEVGRKQKLKSGSEYDVLYARKLYCYLQNRPKNVKMVKRALNRRLRKDSVVVVKQEVVDWETESNFFDDVDLVNLLN